MASLKFPIRIKFLLTVLVLVMLVVGLITVLMANLFHQDKSAYVRDLTTVMVSNLADESDSLIDNYKADLRVFANVVYDETIDAQQKSSLVQTLFANYTDFVSITAYRDGAEPVTVLDEDAFRTAGVETADTAGFRTDDIDVSTFEPGTVRVTNATFNSDLPLIRMATPHVDASGQVMAVLSADLRANRLMEALKRSKAFRASLATRDGLIIVHPNGGVMASRPAIDWPTDVKEFLNNPAMSQNTIELGSGDQALLAGFTKLRNGGLVARTEIPSNAANLSARELLTNLVLAALVLFAVAALFVLFMSRRLTRPLEKLSNAANAVGQGNFHVEVQAATRDEIGLLASSFNKMTYELRSREDALKQAQVALVQSEKMAAFGQLGAGIAHEVKNPLAGILGYAQLGLRKLDDDDPVRKNLEVIEKETKRCTEIITNLLKFARQEQAEMSEISVNEVVEDALTIVDHQLTMNEVQIEKDLARDLPEILGNGNQLQQVVMNFAINAQQAMGEAGGTVRVTSRAIPGDRIEIEISDTGPGIPADVADKIFEPFFTTKPSGKGTGLGLSVSYGIIQDHGGEIRLLSQPGEGARFIITLPSIAEAAEPEAEAA